MAKPIFHCKRVAFCAPSCGNDSAVMTCAPTFQFGLTFLNDNELCKHDLKSRTTTLCTATVCHRGGGEQLYFSEETFMMARFQRYERLMPPLKMMVSSTAKVYLVNNKKNSINLLLKVLNESLLHPNRLEPNTIGHMF